MIRSFYMTSCQQAHLEKLLEWLFSYVAHTHCWCILPNQNIHSHKDDGTSGFPSNAMPCLSKVSFCVHLKRRTSIDYFIRQSSAGSSLQSACTIMLTQTSFTSFLSPASKMLSTLFSFDKSSPHVIPGMRGVRGSIFGSDPKLSP
mmetsp:Transcript_5551/g.19506  ORF Transcript_5551/g.19506 Transcript_5551/m.19506 type:complete len:145 (-) Transcript_5551:525-959(-)